MKCYFVEKMDQSARTAAKATEKEKSSEKENQDMVKDGETVEGNTMTAEIN